MTTYEVIMAGGGGSRFWPLSRMRRPKQLLNISGRDIMLNETILRLDEMIDRENVYIVTNQDQKPLMQELLLGGIPFRNILTEPVGRNTAPCVLYAASMLEKLKGDGVMCVFPADHHIQNVTEYQRIIKKAASCAETMECIVTIGIKPTYAATGYGYICAGEEVADGVRHARKFVEKPSKEKAEEYIESGMYSWNSGVFVFRISTILKAYRELLPQMMVPMERIMQAVGTSEEQRVLEEEYPKMENISIDYGIMEQSQHVLVLEGDFGWSDVGSFDELETLYKPDEEGNVSIGDTLLLNTKGCIAKSSSRQLTLIGAENLIVVETEDAVLVCKKERAQDVKQAVEQLKMNGRNELL